MASTKIQTCEATDCAYNENKACHAIAITVDKSSPASCATYDPVHDKGGTKMTVGSVGACKVADCKHNENLYCTASQIEVGMKGREISCLTYEKA